MVQLLSECMIVTYIIAAPKVIVDLPYKQANHTQQEDYNFICSTSTTAAIHFKPTKNREAQMTQLKFVESKDSQLLAQDWQNKRNISEAYSEYCNTFIDMLPRFFSMWDRHLDQISIPKHRLALLPNLSPVHSLVPPYESSNALILKTCYLKM